MDKHKQFELLAHKPTQLGSREETAAIQGDLNKLEKRADNSITKFYKGKGKVLNLESNNSTHQ